MTDPSKSQTRDATPDWFVQGILTKMGDLFDRLLGRGWKPSSSLATSEIVERLKALLDAEVKEEGGQQFVPNNITLKMQWDKFSTDSDEDLRRFENELLTAMVDHINDKRYYTYAPISLIVKPDYFTQGIKLMISFSSLEEEREADIALHSTGGTDKGSAAEDESSRGLAADLKFSLSGSEVRKALELRPGRRLVIGRSKTSDLTLDDPSVSKVHAALLLNSEGKLLLTDTGSTNGTFLRGERIPYGKAREIQSGESATFGSVSVAMTFGPSTSQAAIEHDSPQNTATPGGADREFEKTAAFLSSPLKAEDPLSLDRRRDRIRQIDPNPTRSGTDLEMESDEAVTNG